MAVIKSHIKRVIFNHWSYRTLFKTGVKSSLIFVKNRQCIDFLRLVAEKVVAKV